MASLQEVWQSQSNRLKQTPAYQAAKVWYDNLPPRDRWVLLLVAALALLALLYVGVWQSIQDNLAKAEQRYEQQQALLLWMRQAEPKLKQLGGNRAKQQTNRPQAGGESVLAVVSRTAKQQGLVLKKFEPDGPNGLRIWMDATPFNKTIGWIEALQKQNNVSVEQVNIDKTAPGLVNLRATLKRT